MYSNITIFVMSRKINIPRFIMNIPPMAPHDVISPHVADNTESKSTSPITFTMTIPGVNSPIIGTISLPHKPKPKSLKPIRFTMTIPI